MVDMARSKFISGFLLLVMFSVSASCEGKRVLLLPYNFASHIRQLLTIGEALAEEGHEVYMGLARSYPNKDQFKGSKVKLIIHEASKKDVYMLTQKEMTNFIKEVQTTADTDVSLQENYDVLLHMCTNPLSDEKYYETLKELKFDIAIVHVFAMTRCLLILPYNLDIPFIGHTSVFEPWITRTPAFPSVAPSNRLPNVYTDHMSFFERLSNLWQNVRWVAFKSRRLSLLSDDNMMGFIRNKPLISVNELASKCMLILNDVEELLDYPRPKMPNEINIGGVLPHDPQPLPPDLQEFMDTASEGVILATFGSGFFGLDKTTYNEFKKAFAQIKLRIVWKYAIKGAIDLPTNVKVLNWVPQNDILRHPNTKIFITHCGNGGQTESLYHGVPMIGYPFFTDQPYNCKRIEAHAFGTCLNPKEFKAHHLVDAIHSIMSNETYHKNIKHASNIIRDRHSTPIEHALFWINHVMKYGAKHLRSHALDMPWYEYLMVDIAAFFLAIVLVIVFVFACLIRAAARHLKKPHAKSD